MSEYISQIAKELNVPASGVKAVATLLESQATVPFIARYRKEATGSLDEVVITSIRDRLVQLKELDERRTTVLDTIKKQGKLTPELEGKIQAAATLAVLEDIYLPYKPKRRTRATVAKEKGLEPLAELLFAQGDIDPEKEAVAFVSADKKVMNTEEALAGARDIIAEWVNEKAEARAAMRKLFFEKGIYKSKIVKGKEAEGAKYKDYFEWEEPVKTIPSHRMLAVRRAEKESILMLRVVAPEDEALSILDEIFLKADNLASKEVQRSIDDSYTRLLSLSMETEIRMANKEEADREAIKVFGTNLRQLLMAPPLGQKNVLAIDPGFRTGCKVVCLDRQGKLLYNDAIYPTLESAAQIAKAKSTVLDMVKRFAIEVIAIGNGTASRETESFVKSIGLPKEISVIVVSESGASIYSASEVAREEFPDHDVTVRGAVSIGRRLMDPLAELVKIDPKSIGVGQYQHDVDQTLLKQNLDDIVISCVNQVGVEANTASKELLMYVSGLGKSRAQAVIDYRNQKGPFKSREEFHKITGLGAKGFEQAAGFLRIRGGANPLDTSAVHPESYGIVATMAKDAGCSVVDLIQHDNFRKKIKLENYITDQVGLPTLNDIMAELAKPGRDPRQNFQIFSYKEGVEKLEDLKPGMKLPGVVTNITAFGVFVDVGVHQDGLVHISQLADKFVKDPNEVVKVHQAVSVTVLEVDLERKRIALSMKKDLKLDFSAEKKRGPTTSTS